MKGPPGRRVLDQLIDALSGHLPAGVRTVRTRVGARGGLQIWPVPSDVAEGAEYGFWDEGRREGELLHLEQRGPWLPGGFGSWIPLPARIRVRVDAVAALETVQDAVRTVDETWPAPDAEVRARVEADDVVVWFHGSGGVPLPPPVRLPRAAFERGQEP